MTRKASEGISDELEALACRADRAIAQAGDLLRQNEQWRQLANRQLEYMFELGAELRKATRIASPDRS